MNVSLTPELEAYVARKVEGGRYNSASEVVREALRLLEEQDKTRDAHAALFNGVAQPAGLAGSWRKGGCRRGSRADYETVRCAEKDERMSRRYVLGVDVELDLEQIWDYIAEDNIDAADRWIDKLFGVFESLAADPWMGHKREDLTELAVLFWPVGAYLIIYRVQREQIEIVAITQGARDVPAFLSERG